MCIRTAIVDMRQALVDEAGVLELMGAVGSVEWRLVGSIRKVLSRGVSLGRWGLFDLDELVSLLLTCTNLLDERVDKDHPCRMALARAFRILEQECPTAWLIEWVDELQDLRSSGTHGKGFDLAVQLDGRLDGLRRELRRRADQGDAAVKGWDQIGGNTGTFDRLPRVSPDAPRTAATANGYVSLRADCDRGNVIHIARAVRHESRS
jgi:hypothetical protein